MAKNGKPGNGHRNGQVDKRSQVINPKTEMGKQKFYVVWKGRITGIFNSWEDCNTQIKGFPGAEFKSFKTKQLAEQAFKSKSSEFIGKDIFESELTVEQRKLIGDPIEDSRNAIGWVKDMEAPTNHEPSEKNKPLFDMINHALKWLNENKYPNQILKWETRAWGENPADFGRK